MPVKYVLLIEELQLFLPLYCKVCSTCQGPIDVQLDTNFQVTKANMQVVLNLSQRDIEAIDEVDKMFYVEQMLLLSIRGDNVQLEYHIHPMI